MPVKTLNLHPGGIVGVMVLTFMALLLILRVEEIMVISNLKLL